MWGPRLSRIYLPQKQGKSLDGRSITSHLILFNFINYKQGNGLDSQFIISIVFNFINTFNKRSIGLYRMMITRWA